VAASQFVISRLFKSLPYNISLSKENRCRIYPCDPKELSFFCDNDHFYTQKCILKRLQTLKCHCNRHTRTHTQTVCNTAGSRSLARVPIDLQAGWSDRTSVCPAVVQPYRPGPARPGRVVPERFLRLKKGTQHDDASECLPGRTVGRYWLRLLSANSGQTSPSGRNPPPWTNQLFPHTHSGLESTRQSLSAFLQNSFL